jgi:hypothetical protein
MNDLVIILKQFYFTLERKKKFLTLTNVSKKPSQKNCQKSKVKKKFLEKRPNVKSVVGLVTLV